MASMPDHRSFNEYEEYMTNQLVMVGYIHDQTINRTANSKETICLLLNGYIHVIANDTHNKNVEKGDMEKWKMVDIDLESIRNREIGMGVISFVKKISNRHYHDNKT